MAAEDFPKTSLPEVNTRRLRRRVVFLGGKKTGKIQRGQNKEKSFFFVFFFKCVFTFFGTFRGCFSMFFCLIVVFSCVSMFFGLFLFFFWFVHFLVTF